MNRFRHNEQKGDLPAPDTSGPATPEQVGTIRRLIARMTWTPLDSWMQTKFGFKKVETSAQAALFIDALNGMSHKHDLEKGMFARGPAVAHGRRRAVNARNKAKRRSRADLPELLDARQPATPEQLAAVERLSHAIKWHNCFGAWLRTKCGLERITLYGQAEEAIAGLKNLLEEQMRRPRGAAPPDECACLR